MTPSKFSPEEWRRLMVWARIVGGFMALCVVAESTRAYFSEPATVAVAAQTPQKEKSRDYENLLALGNAAKATGPVIDYDISPWAESLDLTVLGLAPDRARIYAFSFCAEVNEKPPRFDRPWFLRVFISGVETPIAQCVLVGAKQG